MDPHDETSQQPGSDHAALPESTKPASLPPARRWEPSGTWQTGSLLALINGVFVAVGGVFITTSSVIITVIASVVSLLIALMVLLKS